VVLLALAVLSALVVRNRLHSSSDGAAAAAASAGGGKPRAGGELRVGVTRVGSLDPAQARTVEQLLVADQLFDTLTTPNPATLEPQPELASRWQSSPDLRQWDFTLRPGATFANGRPITADDVKYTLERIARPDLASPAADLLAPITGDAAFVQGKAPGIAGITVLAPDTVRIALDAPMAVLPSVLSSPVFGVVPREAVEAAPPAPAFAQAPVGSGPFTFSATVGDTIELVPAKGHDSFLSKLLFRQFDDVATSYQAFQRGDLDWSRVPPEQVADASRRYGPKAFRPYLAELFYGFNLRSPKFADPRFREAIVHAIDRRAIDTAVYASTVLPLDGLVVAGVPGHQSDACGDRCAHDVAKAKALVAQAFPAGTTPPEIFIDYDQDETQAAVAKAIQAGLGEAGIKATLRPKALSDYQSFAVSGQQELFRLGWIGAYPSPDAFLPPLVATGSTSNLTGFSSPAVDQGLAAARAEPDPAKRVALYQTAERDVMAQLPVIPIAQFQLHSVESGRVRGLAPTAMGTFDASVVWLAGGA
jgi:ABC-type transport system substrate-binding protein